MCNAAVTLGSTPTKTSFHRLLHPHHPAVYDDFIVSVPILDLSAPIHVARTRGGDSTYR